jgi:CBS domain-containing protein
MGLSTWMVRSHDSSRRRATAVHRADGEWRWWRVRTDTHNANDESEALVSIQSLLKAKGRFVPIISSDVTIADVIDKLEIDKAGALVVTDDSHTILGLITERDIARGLKKFGRNIVDKPVGELMTRLVQTCDIEQSVESVFRLMDEHQIQYVPITMNGQLYGIINMLDLVKYRLSQIDAEANALKAYVLGAPHTGAGGSL